LYMDCDGLPPMFFLATDNEILLDETVMLARRMHDAGVQTLCHVWPRLPHAFVLFEDYFSEVRPARDEIVEFARRHLRKPASAECAA
jgi:monoterpene epsilon-lactone hydrolase